MKPHFVDSTSSQQKTRTLQADERCVCQVDRQYFDFLSVFILKSRKSTKIGARNSHLHWRFYRFITNLPNSNLFSLLQIEFNTNAFLFIWITVEKRIGKTIRPLIIVIHVVIIHVVIIHVVIIHVVIVHVVIIHVVIVHVVIVHIVIHLVHVALPVTIATD